MEIINIRRLCFSSLTAVVDDGTMVSAHSSKSHNDSTRNVAFRVYCKNCESVNRGKLRVYCSDCSATSILVKRDPVEWDDVILS